jgi:hypothetical protein
MNIIEVKSAITEKAFLAINAELNQGNPNYIRPLDNEVKQVFDSTKNKLFQSGDAARWILQNADGKTIGRIAAFYYKEYKNKGTEYPVGCIGFFDCINEQGCANLLFDTAKYGCNKMAWKPWMALSILETETNGGA